MGLDRNFRVNDRGVNRHVTMSKARKYKEECEMRAYWRFRVKYEVPSFRRLWKRVAGDQDERGLRRGSSAMFYRSGKTCGEGASIVRSLLAVFCYGFCQ